MPELLFHIFRFLNAYRPILQSNSNCAGGMTGRGPVLVQFPRLLQSPCEAPPGPTSMSLSSLVVGGLVLVKCSLDNFSEGQPPARP